MRAIVRIAFAIAAILAGCAVISVLLSLVTFWGLCVVGLVGFAILAFVAWAHDAIPDN